MPEQLSQQLISSVDVAGSCSFSIGIVIIIVGIPKKVGLQFTQTTHPHDDGAVSHVLHRRSRKSRSTLSC
jgi:hypothetical protein